MSTGAWIDGEAATAVPLRDRGLQFGDGVFRTLLLWRGRPVWPEQQIERLRTDAGRIGLTPPPTAQLDRDLMLATQAGGSAAIKLMLTAGDSARGYRRPDAPCRRIVQRAALPAWSADCWRQGIRVASLGLRLSRQPAFGGAKHLNRLEQVLARRLLPEDCQEGLLCNESGDLIGGTMSNLFWYADGCWHTPPVGDAGVAGLSRDRILQQARQLGLAVRIKHRAAAEIRLHCERLFVCNALIGIWPVATWDDRRFEARHDDRIGLAALRNSIGHPLAQTDHMKTL